MSGDGFKIHTANHLSLGNGAGGANEIETAKTGKYALRSGTTAVTGSGAQNRLQNSAYRIDHTPPVRFA